MLVLRKKVAGLAIIFAVVGIGIAVVVLESEKNEFETIEAAVPGWLSKTGCAKIEVIKPSTNPGFVRWAGTGTTTAMINCEFVSGGLEYARFPSLVALTSVLSSRSAPGKLCVAGRTVLEDGLLGIEESRKFDGMCKNLDGRVYSPKVIGRR